MTQGVRAYGVGEVCGDAIAACLASNGQEHLLCVRTRIEGGTSSLVVFETVPQRLVASGYNCGPELQKSKALPQSMLQTSDQSTSRSTK